MYHDDSKGQKLDAEVIVNVQEENTFDDPRVSEEPRETAVTVAYVEEVSSKNTQGTCQVVVFLIVLGVIGMMLVISSFTGRSKAADKSYSEEKTNNFVWKNSKYYDKVEKLGDEQCLIIFKRHYQTVITKPLVPSGVKNKDVRLDTAAKSNQVLSNMEKHRNPLLRAIYHKFKAMTTLHIAIILGNLSKYDSDEDSSFDSNSSSPDSKHTFVDTVFAHQACAVMLIDENFRRYLAYRGLRRKFKYGQFSGKWATVVYGRGPERKWSLIPDSSGPQDMTPNIISLANSIGKELAEWSPLESMFVDQELSGANDFANNNLVKEGSNTIIDLGIKDLGL